MPSQRTLSNSYLRVWNVENERTQAANRCMNHDHGVKAKQWTERRIHGYNGRFSENTGRCMNEAKYAVETSNTMTFYCGVCVPQRYKKAAEGRLRDRETDK